MKQEENLTNLNELKECYNYGIAQFDRLQVYISAIALGWHMTILDIKSINVYFEAILSKIAIISFGLTLILSITNHFLSARISYNNALNTENKKIYSDNIVKYINMIILISVIVGITSTIITSLIKF